MPYIVRLSWPCYFYSGLSFHIKFKGLRLKNTLSHRLQISVPHRVSNRYAALTYVYMLQGKGRFSTRFSVGFEISVSGVFYIQDKLI